jgi:hypothetical protein
MGMGVALGALMLNFSRVSRAAAELSVYDFRLALILAGVFGGFALLSYAGLARDAGAEISGHRPVTR